MIRSKQAYAEMTEQASPKTKSGRNVLIAFVVGGLICVLGEWLAKVGIFLGIEEQLAGTFASVTLIALATLLTGLGIYHKIAKHAGAGTLVPITGFANAVASPALEFKSEGFILGVGAKMFVVAGAVIVYGISASVVYGVILYILIGFGIVPVV